MRPWICAVLSVIVGAAALVVIRLAHHDRTYGVVDDSLERTLRADFARCRTVSPTGVGGHGGLLPFGTLLHDRRGKSTDAEFIGLAKSADPVAALLALYLLGPGHRPYVWTFRDDPRTVEYRSGCVIRGFFTVGQVVRSDFFDGEPSAAVLFRLMLFGR
jgi:hypothetical protein